MKYLVWTFAKSGLYLNGRWLIWLVLLFQFPAYVQDRMPEKNTFALPEPVLEGTLSVEEAIYSRRSVREYKDEPITLPEVAQLLWAAQGRTSRRGYRTTPSAGALYPIEMILVAGQVDSLSPGVYRYLAQSHRLRRILDGDQRITVYGLALEQDPIKKAPAVIIICGVYERTSQKYGNRAPRYVHIEAGHISQNIYLQCESLGLGTVIIGAFKDQELRQALRLGRRDRPLAIMPLGRRK